MNVIITEAEPLKALTVKSVTSVKDLGSTIIKSLDQVYAFLNLRQISNRGKNIVLYYDSKMTIEAGVIISDTVKEEGNIIWTSVPGGRVLRYIHIGPYSELFRANNLIHEYVNKNNIALTGLSWEIYGHWNEDERKLETEVFFGIKNFEE